MTPADIAALRGLCERATPGPWEVEESDDYLPGQVFGISGGEHGNEKIVETDAGVYPPKQADAAFICAARSALPALLDRCEAAERLLPRCSGTWLAGSGGHRKYAHDCARPGIWDIGGQYVCDEHKHSKGDADAWQWHKERELLVEMAGGESIESVVERALIATTARDKLAREVVEATADVANLRAGHCLAVIPETFIACGEGGNYCSETCRLRTLLAEAVEIARTLGDQAEANADRDDDGWMSQYVNISTRLAVLERLCGAKEGA